MKEDTIPKQSQSDKQAFLFPQSDAYEIGLSECSRKDSFHFHCTILSMFSTWQSIKKRVYVRHRFGSLGNGNRFTFSYSLCVILCFYSEPSKDRVGGLFLCIFHCQYLLFVKTHSLRWDRGWLGRETS